MRVCVAVFGFLFASAVACSPDGGPLAGGSSDRGVAGKADGGSCDGGVVDAPVDPVTGDPICPPYDRPAVFFAPHPDDETLGMAGAIAEHRDAGRDVFIELMSHGRGTIARKRLGDGGAHAWHPDVHDFALSRDDIGQARVREFLDAVATLGVTGVFVSDFGSDGVTAGEASTRVQWWLDVQRDDLGRLSLKGTAEEPRSADGLPPHPDHAAVWAALVGSGHPDVRGYFVYKYWGTSAIPSRVDALGEWCSDKADAMEAYRHWDPEMGRFAVGYHSVPDLFEAARSDCREFVVIPR